MIRYRNCVYRFINNKDQIIYIGKALNLEKRINNRGHKDGHLPKQCYAEIAVIQYVELETKNDMDFAERYYIQKYNPIYNDVNSDKPINIEIRELDIKLWSTYYIDKQEVLRQIEEFKFRNLIAFSEYYKYIKIKIDVDILDYVNVFTLQKNKDFENYKLYKAYENRGELHELKDWSYEYLDPEHKNYRNIATLEKLRNIEKDIRVKIKNELDTIFNYYKLLTYSFVCMHQEGNEKDTFFGMNMVDFNQKINLGCNYFKIDLLAYCKFNTSGNSQCKRCNAKENCEDSKYRVKYPIHVECN